MKLSKASRINLKPFQFNRFGQPVIEAHNRQPVDLFLGRDKDGGQLQRMGSSNGVNPKEPQGSLFHTVNGGNLIYGLIQVIHAASGSFKSFIPHAATGRAEYLHLCQGPNQDLPIGAIDTGTEF
jgi:hypothetical protein